MADVTKNILFTVGTVGATNAASKMGKLATQIGLAATAATLLGKKFYEMSEASARFNRTVDQVNIPMQRFNEQTNGLIDTAKSYTAAANLQNAKVKISAEQFAALGPAATKAAQAAGDGPEGATTRFERLTKAIISGRETALKEFGIEVSQTSDLIAFQSEALQKLTEDYGDFEAQLETTGEKLYALQNTLGTITDFEMESFKKQWSSIAVELLSGSDVMSQWEKDLVATKGEMNNFFSILTSGEEIVMAHNDAMWEGVDVAKVALEGSGKLIRSKEEEAAAYRLIYQNLRQVVVLEETRARIAQQAAAGTTGAARGITAGARSGIGAIAKDARNQLDANLRGSGGGGGRVARSETTAGGGLFNPVAGSSVDPFGGGLLEDITGQGAFDAAGSEFDAERARREELNQIAIEEQQKLNDAMKQLYLQDAENRRKAQDLGIETLGNFAEAASELGTKNVVAEKALMASYTTARGVVASMDMFQKVLAVSGPFGIPAALAAASSVAAIYAVQVKKILEPPGKNSTSSGIRGGGAAGANLSAGSLGSGKSSAGNTTVVNNIIVEGQTIHSSMIRANERAQQNGQPSFAQG